MELWDNCVANPLSLVDEIYYKASSNVSSKPSAKDLMKVIASIANRFRSEVVFDEGRDNERTFAKNPPSLNCLKSDDLRDGMLVQFRGMVQDMFESEIFLADYPASAKQGDTSEQRPRRLCGLFRDAVPADVGGRSFDAVSGDCTLLDRQSLYCVPVPGESYWVKEFDEITINKAPIISEEPMQTESNPTAQNLKRSCDEDIDIGEEECTKKKPKPDERSDNNNIKNENTSKTTTTTKQFDLNYPLANEKGPAVIVKIYDSNSDLKVCDVCEFVGILSLDPSLDSNVQMDSTEMETETLQHSPPTSLVPRVHVIVAQKVATYNPLLPKLLRKVNENDVQNTASATTTTTPVGEDAATVEKAALTLKELAALTEAKATLTSLLKTLLMGDALAAEYLLCHLVSSIHSRRDLRPIGKMTLNISNCPSGLSLGKRIAQVLELLCPCVDRLPMSLPVLNGPPFVPVKDYESNRLKSGRLQLSKGTEVVLDETVLSPGQLNEKGVRNLTILGNLIQWQKLDYDFKWTTQEFPTDLRLIVVSEGKSILPSDVQIHLNASSNVDVDEYDANLNNMMTSVTSLETLRRFLSLVQICPYRVEADVQKMVEEDFVAARAENERNMTVEDFERLLLLSRYVTLTEAPTTGGRLNVDAWNRCKRMEEERKSRIPVPRPAADGRNGEEAGTVRVGVEQ